MSIASLRDLRRLIGHPAGSWFLGEDHLGHKPGRSRRWILTRELEAGPHVVALPRTTKLERVETGTWTHDPHEPGHQAACCIDKPGRVLSRRRCTLRGSELEPYCCQEPDEDLVEWAKRQGGPP